MSTHIHALCPYYLLFFTVFQDVCVIWTYIFLSCSSRHQDWYDVKFGLKGGKGHVFLQCNCIIFGKNGWSIIFLYFILFILFMEARTISTTRQVQHVHLLLKFKTYMDILHSHMYYYTQLQHLSKYIISFI